MNKWLIIVCIVLAVLVVGVGLGCFVFYGNYRYDTGFEAGDTAGYQRGTADLKTEVETAHQEGYQEGYDGAYGEVAERIKFPADVSVDLIKARLDVMAVAPRVRTSTEVVGFLTWDKTNYNTYDAPCYSACFARDVRINAQDQGFKTGIVFLICRGATYHLVVFDTSDLGLIFIEPSWDKPVSVLEGRSFAAQNGWSRPSFDDVIVDVVIFW